MKAKINVDFEFLKGANFDHRHFHITDSNDVTLAYGNELVKNAKFINGVSMDLYPNTLTVFSAHPNGAYKYEFLEQISMSSTGIGGCKEALANINDI